MTKFVPTTLRRSLSGHHSVRQDGNGVSKHGRGAAAAHHARRRRSSAAVRRPADGRAPGRQDPEAVAKAEAAAKLAYIQAHRVGVDPTWQLPTNVDYYTDRGEAPAG